MPELLLEETRFFDENYFYSNYQNLPWRDQTLRHIGEHITKAGMKLVDHQEGNTSIEVVINQVIPDLAIYRTQLVNLLGFEPDDIEWEAHKGDEKNVAQSILWAAGMISRYIEPIEHSIDARHENLSVNDLIEVPARLHFAASALAVAHGVNLIESQRVRMSR